MEVLSLETMQKVALLVFAVFVIAAALFVSLFVGWSVLAGGLVVLANLWFAKKKMLRMAGVVTATVSCTDTEQQKAVASSNRRGYLLAFWLRIGITGVVLFVLIRWQLVDIFGLLVGLSTIFVTAMALSLVIAVRYLIQQNQGRR